jgi:hypothetical protein
MNPSPTLTNRTTPDEASTYASLGELVYADRSLADTLERVSVLATQALREAPEVSLTLVEGERAWTAATSGPVALHLDEQQYGNRSGPCLDAALYGEVVQVTMDGPDQPYPDFRRAAQGKAVTHSLSIGLSTGDQVLGALNVYSSTGRPFSDDSDRRSPSAPGSSSPTPSGTARPQPARRSSRWPCRPGLPSSRPRASS